MADSMMSVLFIPPANMRHKNVKNEKKQKDFHKKRKNHLLYPPKKQSSKQGKGSVPAYEQGDTLSVADNAVTVK